MQKTMVVLVVAASLGVAAVSANGMRQGDRLGDVVQSLAAGVVLGRGVWSYGVSPVPPQMQAGLLQPGPDCPQQGGCGSYGLASDSSVLWQPATADTE
jgi:hypothetical protein